MDQDRAGLFSLFLQGALDESIQVDIVKMKRKKIVLRLRVLKDALEHKDYDKANFVLLDICDRVLSDQYVDEYNMTNVQVDMIVFSSAITNVTAKYYDRTEQIITSLIMKYRNPIFYYTLGVSYFYKLCFQEAKEQFSVVINLLENQKNATFLWPDSNILIISANVDHIRQNAYCFLDVIAVIQSVKATNKSVKKAKQTSIEISSTVSTDFDFNVGIGKYIQNEIYPLIKNIIEDLIKFDKWKLPSEYQKIITRLYKPIKLITETPTNNLRKSTSLQKLPGSQMKVDKNKAVPKVNDKKSDTSDGNAKPNEAVETDNNVGKKDKETMTSDKKKERKSETIASKVNKTTPGNMQKSISKKNESIQVQPITKCKSIQTFNIRTSSQYTQTNEDTVLIEKNALIVQQHETISNMRKKLNDLTNKQKTYLKNNSELIEKNRIIEEQQVIISNLRTQLSQTFVKHKEMEENVNQKDTKINELTKTNKTILADLERYKELSVELRNYNQILEKSAKNAGKDRDETKSLCKNLFRKYKDSYSMQIQFYESFQKRCENVLSVLNTIVKYLTAISVPTKEDCQVAINEWLSAMLSCTEALQISKNHIKKYDQINVDEIVFDVTKLLPLLPIIEPVDILMENVPIMIYTIHDYETMLNNRLKKEKLDDQKETLEKDNFNEETDYRKKSNFIHKNIQSPKWCSDEPHMLMFKKPPVSPESKTKTTLSNGESSTKDMEQINLLTVNKKIRALIAYLKQNIPHRSENEVIEALNSFRKQNNGSLSGKTLQYILYNVLTILESPEAAYATVKANCKIEIDNTEDVCPICIELIVKDRKILPCKHVYHTECIRKWLSRNRVCAVCRVYTVLDLDFPPLKT